MKLKRSFLFLIALAGFGSALAEEGLPPVPFDPGMIEFSIKVKQKIIPYRQFGIFVLPGEMVTIEILDGIKPFRFSLIDPKDSSVPLSNNLFVWQAPQEKGLHRIRIRNETSQNEMVLNFFVMVPFTSLKRGFLNGYQVGRYPNIAYQGLKIYEKPPGFVEVTPQIENTPLSPHFKLNQFLSKQKSQYPKYLILKERLILKLELLLQKANEQGYSCTSFVIMSGYRTPFYNKLIGNVKYSRHVWGDAADIFIDEHPQDGYMDDLNNDGVSNYLDAGVLYDLIDRLHGTPLYEPFVGGLGRYRKNQYHGPYVHVDVRGFKARWEQ